MFLQQLLPCVQRTAFISQFVLKGFLSGFGAFLESCLTFHSKAVQQESCSTLTSTHGIHGLNIQGKKKETVPSLKESCDWAEEEHRTCMSEVRGSVLCRVFRSFLKSERDAAALTACGSSFHHRGVTDENRD